LPIVALVRPLPDDGFYDLEKRAPPRRGQGFTFDGVHSTIGFRRSGSSLVPLSRGCSASR
jgi:hypothetical protein